MTGERPFWGQDHLSLDAVVAYVDDELADGAHARARSHLAGCPECGAEVVAQRQARAALRAAAGPCLPSSLLRSLRSIPVEAELPPAPPGLGVTADGQFVLLREMPDPPRRSRWVRFGAVSGLAIGALAVGAFAAPPSTTGVLEGRVLDVPADARLSTPPAVPAVLTATPSATPTPTPAVLDLPR